MFRFQNLQIWQESVNFAGEIYAIIKRLPREEAFALSDQLRRAVISISTNIAEGSGSSSSKDFRNYLNISVKSIFEVISLITIAQRNHYISESEFKSIHDKAEVLVKRIQTFRNSLKP